MLTTHGGFDPQRELLEQILDTIDEGIHAVDREGVTIFYNAAAGRLDGLAPVDVLGKHVLSVFPSLVSETSTLLLVLKTGHAIYNQPQVYTNFLGVKLHTVNTTLPILSGGAVVGALEVAKDLTQVRKLSDQLLALQERVAGGPARRRKGSVSAYGSTAVYRFSHLQSVDGGVADLKQRAARAARTSSPILVYGETGTGKELLVQAIHNESPRQSQPFLALNCAALPAPLLEGILFGTARGSFTGAEDRPGLFELADAGTLFLDEIQSLPLALQAKLLRVLQEGELMRVGDTHVRRINVRVIAALNVRPESAVAAGELRPDLYYRINVVRFDLPPLRQRRGDIDLLTDHFIHKFNRRFHGTVSGLSKPVRDLFLNYPWPGSVRELENAIEAAMNLITEGAIPLDVLPGHLRDWSFREREANEDSAPAEISAGAANPERYLDWALRLSEAGMNSFWSRLQTEGMTDLPWRPLQLAFERMVLERALVSEQGNVKATAGKLGLPRQTLQYRIRQLGL